MNNIPKRRRQARMAHKDETVIRCPSHLAWVRGHECSIAGREHHMCSWPPVEAAHVRTGTDGSMAKKPSDCWAIPLCSDGHARQHKIGETSFEAQYKINMKAIAAELWRTSPHGIKYRATHTPEVK